ncbi:glycosyltransferase family 2 protein [Marinoscillum sp.]|uniref:glycosyltransferase family 2 protein n=1 Tax=Marinoscillum sp. TaxID=2024838 RepID=UPI003BA8F0DF
MATVAVVILNYNGSHFLEKFLPTLINHSSEATIYVADNCSTDDSLEVLRRFPTVKTIELAENTGYAGGYNAALRQIDADYFALVNSDIEVTKSWLQPLIQFMERNPEYAAVQPKIKDYQNREYFEYAGASGGYLDWMGYPYCRGRIFDTIEKDIGQYDTRSDVFWTTGACFMIRRSDFLQLDGFPSDFFAHMEEIDLCWRLQSAKRMLACIPSSVVYHVGGGTLNKTSPRKTYLNFRNNLRLLTRNLPKKHLLWVIPLRICLDWFAGFVFWKKQSFAHFQAILQAHWHALKSLTDDLKKTERSKPSGVKSILIQYYFRKKREFSKLSSTR